VAGTADPYDQPQFAGLVGTESGGMSVYKQPMGTAAITLKAAAGGDPASVGLTR